MLGHVLRPRLHASPAGASLLKRQFPRLVVPLVLLTLTLLFFHKLAFTDLILARGDTYAYFYPYWHVRNAALMSGQLPLWSPDLFMGVPLLGNSQIGTFYPPNWLVAPLSPPDGVRVSILFHVWWAALGAFVLARRTLNVSRLAALVAAVIFAFGGHIGAHVEQINQLQGLSWLPWLLYLFDRTLRRPLPNVLLLGMGLALQFFSGHTQTVFISGVALTLYALCTRPRRGILALAGASITALVLSVPQLIPTLELTQLSNRRGGLSLNQATAFSFSPFVTGRGLLPSFDTLIFGEYVAYPGIIGLGLALVGAFADAHLKPLRQLFNRKVAIRSRFSPLSTKWRGDGGEVFTFRARWLIITLIGLALAYGIYNPLYWLLTALPGFNFFRVPARWLALFALGAAMLAALGIDWLKRGAQPVLPLQRISWRLGGSILLFFLILAASSALTLRQNDLTPVNLPTPLTLLGWGIALVVLLVGLWRRAPKLLAAALLIELALASIIMPYNQLVPPDSYSSQRFTISQLLALTQDQIPPPRTLSISQLLFDPGDRASLRARYDALGMSPEAVALAFDTVKMRETLAANQPLVWGIPSVDGFDGGLLPTTYYSAFTSLFLPDGERTSDGRLRELLALPECNGACIPDQRWLDLMGVRYLITDKNYDLVHDGIFYDTTFSETDHDYFYINWEGFTADAVDLICTYCDPNGLDVYFGEQARQNTSTIFNNIYQRLRYVLSEPINAQAVEIVVSGITDGQIIAVTLVDTRTGDFQQLTPMPWTRVLSSDIKLYQRFSYNRIAELWDAGYRSFFTPNARYVTDDEAGTQAALTHMRASSFSPTFTVVLAGEGEELPLSNAEGTSTITAYTDTRVALSIDVPVSGVLVLTDAYYPGWVATVNGEPTPVERANIMFRAVRVPAGQSEVIFEYRPSWLPAAPIIGGAAWLVALLAVIAFRLAKWGRRA